MSHSFKDAIYFYTVALAQNVLSAYLACKKKARYQNYISDICLVLNIHDQLAALKVSLKDSLARSASRITHTYALTVTQHQNKGLFCCLSAFLSPAQYSEEIR